MKMIEFFVRRPVFTTVMTVGILIFGLVSYWYIPLRQYPRVDLPMISVVTTYEGASPQIVESRITKLLESVLAGIEGVDLVTSVSSDESSRITLTFRPKQDVDAAAADVRDRIGRVRSRLPEGVRDPLVKKSEADAMSIIHLAFYSAKDDVPTAELFDYFKMHIETELEAIPGVAGVEPYGSSGHTMRIWLDPIKMASYKITTHDVSAALRQQNVHMPAGRVRAGDREYMVTTAATLKTAEAFNQVVVSQQTNGNIVRISDIGHAEFIPEPDKQTFAYFNGHPAIAIGLVKKSVANPLEVRSELSAVLPKMRRSLPEGYLLDVAYDRTMYISAALMEVLRTFIEAIIFVTLVVFVFLWSWRAALIPLVAIPVSLSGTAVLLYVFGFSINTLTLLAVVLAIGLVVDDAIVVMENIHRYLGKTSNRKEAAIAGGQEIAFAVIAMTLTLSAVYFPITLARGSIGKFFTEFAVTLAGAVIVSGWVALTLSPMMCSLFLKKEDLDVKNSSQTKIGRALSYLYVERYIPHLETWLRRGIMSAYNNMKAFIFFILLLVAGSAVVFKNLPSELVPKEDQGLVNVGALVPQGASPEYLNRYMLEVDSILSKVPDVKNRLTIVASPTPAVWGLLHPWRERTRTSVQMIDQELRDKLKSVAGLIAYASPGSTILGGGGSNDQAVQFVLETTQSFSELDSAAQFVESVLRARKILPYLTTDRGEDTQEFCVNVDRDKALSMGVTVQTIAETLDTFIAGRRITDFRKDSEQYDVIASMPLWERRNIDDLGHVYVRATPEGRFSGDSMIPLDQLISVQTMAIPLQINHYNQLRSVTLSGELAKHVSLGEAVNIFEKIASEVLPEGVRYEFAGQTKQYLESRFVLLFVFLLAIVFIYLVLAAQFESFVDPLIILFTVPLSLGGAVTVLWLVAGSLNVYTQVGLITLIGLITKHGILLVDFANKKRLQDQSISAIDAVCEASLLRLRPILMTTAAMILGALPLTLAVGAGAESRRQIGWVIVGGMFIGTLFTFFVIPIVYELFAKMKKRFAYG